MELSCIKGRRDIKLQIKNMLLGGGDTGSI